MKRRIDSMIRRNNLEKYIDYFNLLNSSPSHLNDFLNYITINVSEFFRNKNQWIILENKILPVILNQKKRILIWSTACSTGEEPYSIAMIFYKLNAYKTAKIIATDIDDRVLNSAENGIYTEKDISSLPLEYKKRFFKPLPSGSYEIVTPIKNMVNFEKHNLLKDDYPENCDLIICRNVLIYFTEHAKSQIYKKFYKSLSAEGVLFVGNTEQIILPHKYGFNVLEHFFYTKA